MSEDITQRIAEAMLTELERQAETDIFGLCVGRADDECLIDGYVQIPAIAAAVVAELGLTQEWSKTWTGDRGAKFRGMTHGSPDALGPMGRGCSAETRYVTEWTRA